MLNQLLLTEFTLCRRQYNCTSPISPPPTDRNTLVSVCNPYILPSSKVSIASKPHTHMQRAKLYLLHIPDLITFFLLDNVFSFILVFEIKHVLYSFLLRLWCQKRNYNFRTVSENDNPRLLETRKL